ncbi:MAG: trehalose-phosphatase [Myxococcales bacterium]|nr:trehalose-phosphatase [Myxococcales bacterium]
MLALDFDGTLAPIVSQPDQARLPDSTRHLLQPLALRYPCIVVSGRARSDVTCRMEGIALAEIIGNHGSEPWSDLEPLRCWTARVLPVLRQCLSAIPGVEIEDKAASISVHYRRAFHRQRVIDMTSAVATDLGAGALIPGKYVLSLLPPGALHKGQGLLRALDAFGCSHALFLGDDATDEPAFALAAEQRVLGIRVGYRAASAACLYLKNQSEVDLLLHRILSARS